MLIWEGGNPTHQGTGFLATTPGGQVVGITSAHFVNFDGPPLLEVRWLRIGTAQAVARFDRSLGPPGSAGLTEPKLDLRPDYLLLVGHVSASEVKTLELDERPNPEIGEKVWLPNKDPAAESGYRLIPGTVGAAAPTHSAVHFRQAFKLQSQSGSPVISQRTGKVIGTLSRGTETPKGLILFLTPARAILDAMEAKDRPKLKDVIGTKR